jgi:hypothetical protein
VCPVDSAKLISIQSNHLTHIQLERGAAALRAAVDERDSAYAVAQSGLPVSDLRPSLVALIAARPLGPGVST